jgi:hypothetical protein
VPAFLLWIGASGAGCLALPAGADVWGDTLGEAGQCPGAAATLLTLMALAVSALAARLRARR